MFLPRAIYPPLNMHFSVEFKNKYLSKDKNFQSVHGLQARIVNDESTDKSFPVFENIILRRAYQPISKLVKWCMNAINNNKKQPIDIVVKLLNAEHDMLSGWKIEKAIPIAWGVEELHAQETKVLIEIIELSYLRFQVLDSKGNIIAPVPTVKANKADKT